MEVLSGFTERSKGKTLTWRMLLKQEANARLERYVNVRGCRKQSAAINAVFPLKSDEDTPYRRQVWRDECYRLIDIRRHPPKATAFALSAE